MAAFDVSYIIKAVDKFSPVINKIEDSFSKLDSSLGESSKYFEEFASRMEKSSKASQEAFERMAASIEKSIKNLNTSFQTIHEPRLKPFVAPPVNFEKAESSFSRFAEWMAHKGDSLAWGGFMSSMNIMMPMMAFIKPFQDLMKSQNAITAMKIQGENVDLLQRQASSLAGSSAFSAGGILQTQALLASHGATTATIQKLMPKIAAIAAATNQTLAQVAGQVDQTVWGKGTKAVGSLIISGNTQAQRIQSLASQIALKYPDALKKQMQSTSGQLRKASNEIGDSMEKMVQGALPAITQIAKVMAKAADAVGNWMQKNKSLAKALIYVAGAVIGLIAAQIIFGAVMSGFGLIFKTVGKAIEFYEGVVKAAKWATILFTDALKDNPFGLIIIALAAIATGIVYAITHWKKFKHTVWNVANDVNNVIYKYIIDPIEYLSNKVLNLLPKSLQKMIKGTLDGLKKAVEFVFSGLKSVIQGGIVEPIKEIKTVIENYIIKPLETVFRKLSGLKNIVEHPITSLGRGVAYVGSGLAHAADKVGDFFSWAGKGTWDWITGEHSPPTTLAAQKLSTTVLNHNTNINHNHVHIQGQRHSTSTNVSSGFSNTYIGTPTLLLG